MPVVRIDFQPNKRGARKGAVAVYNGDETTPLVCDVFDIASEDRRARFVDRVTKVYPSIPADELMKALLEKAGGVLAYDNAHERSEHEGGDPLSETPKGIVDDATKILRSADLFDRILADIESMGVAGEDDLKLMAYVVMTSRLMDKPLSAIVQGASSSGKSYVIETVAKMMPPEAVVQAHDFTDQALYYLPVGSLEHKVVVSGERIQEHRGKDGHAEDNSKAFREMVGSGVLRKAVTVKGSDGKPTTELIEQPGPIAFLESSTATHINDEDSTRLLPLVTDESAEQTQKIVEAQRRAAKGLDLGSEKEKEIIIRHQSMQRLLRPICVRIPWIDSISLPVTNVATRRTYDQLRYAISSVAFLRQHQKEIQTDLETQEEFIEADEIDYTVAHRLMKGVLLRKYSPLDSHARNMLEVIVNQSKKVSDGIKHYDEFTQADCERWTGVSNATVRRRLGPLVAVGILSDDTSGKPYKYRVVKADLARAIDLHLPTPEDIAERIAMMLVQA